MPNKSHDGYLAICYLAERIEYLEERLAERGKQFVPPTLIEVWDYAKEIGFPALDAEAFMAHYESNGWRVGVNKVRSWKGCVRTWRQRHQADRAIKHKSESDTIPLMN